MFVNDPKLRLYAAGATKSTVRLVGKLPGAVANWKLVPSEGPLQEEAREELDDGWLIRLSLIARASTDPVLLNQEQIKKRVTLFDQIRSVLKHTKGRRHEIKSLTVGQIQALWNARFVAYGLPNCPPLLRVRAISHRFPADRALYEADKLIHDLRTLFYELRAEPRL
jgi:hypothetical protein